MTDEIRHKVAHLLRLLFPGNAMISTSVRNGGLLISVCWRLGDKRMENWSKEIRILISREVVERYEKLNEKGRAKANGNLVSFVQQRLGDFDPHHDRPRFLLPPVEVWEMKFKDIFPEPAKAR